MPKPMDNRSIFLYHPDSFDQCRMLRGTLRGETCAVEAGREMMEANPIIVDREATKRVGCKPARCNRTCAAKKGLLGRVQSDRTANRHR